MTGVESWTPGGINRRRQERHLEEGHMADSSGDSSPGEIGRRLGGGAIALLIGLGALAIFMLQNTLDVNVKFLVLSFTWPLWLLILVSALVGALIWFGFGVMRRHRRRQERRDNR